MNMDPRTLDAAAVVYQCSAGFIPVNVLPDAAIGAHRQVPTAHTLRAVILACTPTADDSRAQLDYLADLPDAAWKSLGMPTSWQSYRELTLAAIRRSIAWRTICACIRLYCARFVLRASIRFARMAATLF